MGYKKCMGPKCGGINYILDDEDLCDNCKEEFLSMDKNEFTRVQRSFIIKGQKHPYYIYDKHHLVGEIDQRVASRDKRAEIKFYPQFISEYSVWHRLQNSQNRTMSFFEFEDIMKNSNGSWTYTGNVKTRDDKTG